MPPDPLHGSGEVTAVAEEAEGALNSDGAVSEAHRTGGAGVVVEFVNEFKGVESAERDGAAGEVGGEAAEEDGFREKGGEGRGEREGEEDLVGEEVGDGLAEDEFEGPDGGIGRREERRGRMGGVG